MGVIYSWGGRTPEGGLDCSGFVRFVFQQATNLTLPHGARALSQMGTHVSSNDLQPGDLVFFNTLKSSFSHVGIYIGDNRFIHSPRTGREVVITDMTEKYWAKRFNGARRIDPR
ncbi:MAG: C40 family peptidase, partial [Methylophilaceae bacterium]